MINYEHKFIFARVAKTASTSILDKLPKCDRLCEEWDYDWNHVPLWHRKQILNENIFNTFFKFAFVRNPFDRAVSIVEYWNKRSKKKGGPTFDFIDFFTGGISSEFIIKDRFFSKYGSQYDFTKGCNFIGKVENLQEDFNIICDKIRITRQELPHKNKSKHKHYTEYYNDEAKRVIAELYARDIEAFNYKFGE
tara:strand:- start:1013 stop:1591 length:579 start_codon:yes stop_codon:yes gene_type:complete